ncbi:MAG: zf-HC2 domain-containing protein [Oscillospiraceae bacterium]|nr:zf-HC2 domain-containing protein [Oscillospiraceae bacterium]
MKNCVGIAELLCAYADGELNDSNKKFVEDHLVICENCSAILKMYGEISSSVNDTNVPAPDALCIGVMNRIQNEETPQKATISKKRRQYRYILTRYAPIAACLVVMLLVFQFWNPIRAFMPAGSSAPETSDALNVMPETASYAYDMGGEDNMAPEEADTGGGFTTGGSATNESIDMTSQVTDDLAPLPSRRSQTGPLQTRSSDIEVSAEPLIPLTIDENSLTPAGVIYTISNKQDDEIEFGEQFFIQVFSDATWVDIVAEESDFGFNGGLFIGQPGDDISLIADWSVMYGPLPEGTYRIVKQIKYSNSDKPAFYIAGEFIIR